MSETPPNELTGAVPLLIEVGRRECRFPMGEISHCGTVFPEGETHWCQPCRARALLKREGIRVEPKMGRLDWLAAEEAYEAFRRGKE